MSFARYLKSSATSIVLCLLGALLLALITKAAGESTQLAILVGLVACIFPALGFVLNYRRKHSFYCQLTEFSADKADPRWFLELVKQPDFTEGNITFNALAAIDKGANDRIAEAHRRVTEYREYIEGWVHEVKSPLAAAHLMVENLQHATDGSSKGSNAADGSNQESGPKEFRFSALDDELTRAENYIEQALFYARSETLDRDYLVRSCILHDLVTSAIKSNARLLIAAHISPRLGSLEHEVFTDEKWMCFVLGQVIQNSAKYAKASNAEICFESHCIHAGLATERIELVISDNGCGVSTADLPRVFDKGFTGDAGRSGNNATGIGLYLVKRLCDKMGIAVSAASNQGKSFTVTFSFSTNRYSYFSE